jgi:FG-GAP-like repeat/FG-GAP repeat
MHSELGLAMQRFLQLPSCLIGAAFIFLAPGLPSGPAQADFIQQGEKLVGTGGGVGSNEGYSVALSADGNTAIIGGPDDNSGAGAAWVFTRSNGVWTPQGGKLLGLGAVGNARQGNSVALSGDGNTAIVGGPNDNSNVGAAWVFTRSNGAWTAQGSKLVGAGAIVSFQGVSVALSADGNTALVGGSLDNGGAGAAWVFTRSGPTWTPQGNKLVPTDASDPAAFGFSVALSADGSTALIGGPSDDGNFGAAWVFTRTAGAWSQYGSKLMGKPLFPNPANQGSSVALSGDGLTALIGAPTDLCGDPGGAYVFTLNNGTWKEQTRMAGDGGTGTPINQGSGVALSGNGNIALVGGPGDNSLAGAAWVFIRRNGIWTQQGHKLVGSGAAGAAYQGYSVALSSSGNTALIGGRLDNKEVGATWVFIPPVNTHDFNGDTVSDIVWRDTSGDIAAWLMSGAAVTSSAGLGNVPTTWSIVGQRDFNGDGNADLLWRDTSGNTAMWLMNGTAVASSLSVGNVPTNWSVVGVADFNGDGLGDLLWRDSSGDIAVWLMNGAAVSSSGALGNVPTTWTVVGTGDFNSDGTADILWRDNLGNTSIWFMIGTTVASTAGVGNIPTNWSVVGTGDFNGDGKTDIVWRDSVGDTSIWLMNGAAVLAAGALGNVPTTWSIVQTGDYNGDGMSDLLWRDNLGNTSMWFMNGATVASTAGLGNIPTNWTVQSVNAE